MTDDLTVTFTVDRTPEEAFAAICDVRAWWSGEVEGRTDALGEEFTYAVPGIHFCRFRITELAAPSRVVWEVLESSLSFIADQEEWTGTSVVFDVGRVDRGTQVRFTHAGLRPEHECFEICQRAWTEYIAGSLRGLLESGTGRPGSFEGEAALEAVAAGR